MHNFNTQQVSNGFIVTFSSERGHYSAPEDIYVFTSAEVMANALPRVLRRRTLKQRRDQKTKAAAGLSI